MKKKIQKPHLILKFALILVTLSLSKAILKAQGVSSEYQQQLNQTLNGKLALLKIWLDSDWTPYGGNRGDMCNFANVLYRSANGGYSSLTLHFPDGDGSLDIWTSQHFMQTCSYNVKVGAEKRCFFGSCTMFVNTVIREGDFLVLYSKNQATGNIARAVVGRKRENWVKNHPTYLAIRRCYETQNLNRCVPEKYMPRNQDL